MLISFTLSTDRKCPIEDASFPRIEFPYEFPAAKATAPSINLGHPIPLRNLVLVEDLMTTTSFSNLEDRVRSLAQGDQLHWITQTEIQ